ncbi:MAG: peptidylprolyl isomerase [Rhodobacteraceae bacterium]|nr:peptidylprolyl isomerase [Paracoccaceae bacterium]
MVVLATAASAENHANPVLVLELVGEASGVVEIELFEDVAPNHVAQIVQLASSGKYDNIVFHRVIAGFMAQTGDVTFGRINGGSTQYAGMGGSDLPDLDSEFSDVPFERGVVGMARSADPNSANSQFFIMFASAPHLTGQYTVIGKVISGQEVVDGIKKGSPSANGSVADPDYIKQATIR